ncbi:hypothetical protein VCRA2113O23_10151 [Vibrio crassostreae]|nr:hypothetical protein VCRA2113O23_10151 [Vibrio crassostreae]
MLTTSVNMNPFQNKWSSAVKRCTQIATVPSNVYLSATLSRQNKKTNTKVKIKGAANANDTVIASKSLWLP